jgi:hypothetical protein
MHPCAYLLANVPPLGDFRPTILARWQQINVWISELMQVNVSSVGSRVHRFWWMWINLAPLEVIQWAYDLIPRSPTCLVDDILDPRSHSCVVHHDDQPPFVVVNRVGLPRITLLTFLSFQHFHAFRNGGPWIIWDSHSSSMEEPNADERERAMGFCTSTTTMQSIF